MNLEVIFDDWNSLHFDGALPRPKLLWNSRLRTTAGRFRPVRRSLAWFGAHQPTIEIASYLQGVENGAALVRDTVGHEMIHYWLWVRKRPYGHTEEFHGKMREMGVNRYNPVPQHRPVKYLYGCIACGLRVPARRKWKTLACAKCCAAHSNGRYDVRFRLRLVEEGEK